MYDTIYKNLPNKQASFSQLLQQHNQSSVYIERIAFIATSVKGR